MQYQFGLDFNLKIYLFLHKYISVLTTVFFVNISSTFSGSFWCLYLSSWSKLSDILLNDKNQIKSKWTFQSKENSSFLMFHPQLPEAYDLLWSSLNVIFQSPKSWIICGKLSVGELLPIKNVITISIQGESWVWYKTSGWDRVSKSVFSKWGLLLMVLTQFPPPQHVITLSSCL